MARILFVGAGGTEGYFGGRLVEAGCDVTFLVREKRAAQLRSDGLVIKSPLGNFSGKVKFVTLSELYASFDMIVLSCKAYDLASVVSDLKGRQSQTAYLLPLLNGLAHYEELDLRFGRERVMGGLCHIGVSLSEHGEVLHNNSSQLVTFGARDPAQRGSCELLHEDLLRANFNAKLSTDIIQDVWEKYVMLTAYAATTCLMQSSIGIIVAAPGGRSLLLEAFEECCQVAIHNQRGPRPEFRNHTIDMLTKPGATATTSMLRDMLKNGRIEADHIVGNMIARAREAGVSTPILQTAFTRLKCYEAQRDGSSGAASSILQ